MTGRELRQWRMELGLTVDQAAQIARISHSTVANTEALHRSEVTGKAVGLENIYAGIQRRRRI